MPTEAAAVRKRLREVQTVGCGWRRAPGRSVDDRVIDGPAAEQRSDYPATMCQEVPGFEPICGPERIEDPFMSDTAAWPESFCQRMSLLPARICLSNEHAANRIDPRLLQGTILERNMSRVQTH